MLIFFFIITNKIIFIYKSYTILIIYYFWLKIKKPRLHTVNFLYKRKVTVDKSNETYDL